MSRVGNKKINIPEDVKVTTGDREVKVIGPRGQQSFKLPAGITAEIIDGQVVVKRQNESKLQRSLHGTVNRVIENMIKGALEGFRKKLEYKGVGFTVAVADNQLTMRLGFSHPINIAIPESLQVSVVKNTIVIEGAVKEEVGAFAATVRETKKPEVYKGKGIRYQGEFIKKKAGKAAQTATTT